MLYQLKGVGGPRPKIVCYDIDVEGKQSYHIFLPDQKILILAGFIAFSKSQNTYNYIVAAQFYLRLSQKF